MDASPADKKPTLSRQNFACAAAKFCRAFGLRAKAARATWVVCGFSACLCIFILVSGFFTARPYSQSEPSFVFRGRVNLEALPAAAPAGNELARMLEAVAVAPYLPDGAVRAKAEAAPAVAPEQLWASIGPKGMVNFTDGRVSVLTAQGGANIARLGESHPLTGNPANIFQADLFADDSGPGPAPLLYGEALDDAGRPLRWTSPLLARLDVDGEPVYGLCEVRRAVWPRFDGLNLAAKAPGRALSAAKYREYVDTYAKKYNLTPSLVLAIMHTESNFNPGAVSPHNALGLMQVVAGTAGEEAHAFLTGTKSVPKMETLFDPESNIRYGTAYLHILNNRYFGEVLREDSRNLCVIAAYNGGPGAVLRVFDTDSEVAIAKINALSPAELYATLAEKMPSQESRRYVGTVLGRMQQYN